MTKDKEPSALRGEPGHVCHFSHSWALDNFVRRWLHNPRKLFGPWVRPGFQILDVGCGPGFATLELAKLAGPEGRVVAADLQPEMLRMVGAKAAKAGLSGRIELHQCPKGSLGLKGPFDFILAFYMVHETPDPAGLVREVHGLLRPGGLFYVVEPRFHVTEEMMEETLAAGKDAGFDTAEMPRIRFSRAAVFRKR